MSLHSTRSNRSGRGASYGAATDANVYQCVRHGMADACS
jgi:hypothetical protein